MVTKFHNNGEVEEEVNIGGTSFTATAAIIGEGYDRLKGTIMGTTKAEAPERIRRPLINQILNDFEDAQDGDYHINKKLTLAAFIHERLAAAVHTDATDLAPAGEKCEWVNKDDDTWVSSCGIDDPETLTPWKWCPFCGKEIK